MKYIFVTLLISVTFALLYLNIATTTIVSRENDSSRAQKIAKIVFVWLVPIIGFAFALRFSYQISPHPLHKRLIPPFIGKWIYDETRRTPNANRDEHWSKSVFGISDHFDK